MTITQLRRAVESAKKIEQEQHRAVEAAQNLEQRVKDARKDAISAIKDYFNVGDVLAEELYEKGIIEQTRVRKRAGKRIPIRKGDTDGASD